MKNSPHVVAVEAAPAKSTDHVFEELEKIILAKVAEKGLGDISKAGSETVAEIAEALS